MRYGRVSNPVHIVIFLLAVAAGSCRSTSPVQVDEPSAFMKGADLSMLARIEELGGVYRDVGKERDGLQIFRSHGFNWIRLRIFHSPDGRGGVVNDIGYTVNLAQRAKRAGFKFLLDFHYSDTWADPGKQFKPAAWDTLSFEALVTAVREYSRDIVAAFRREGVLPDMVQIGNEIRSGMLWPDGRIGGEFDTPAQWQNLAALINAGIDGVRSALEHSDNVIIMVQSDNGASKEITRWFFDNLMAQGVDFDVIGLSYYPRWHGPLDSLRANLASMPAIYDKDVILVECAYPWRAADDDENVVEEFPATPEGQKAFLQELIRIVRRMPEGRGKGVFYWAPEWIPVNGRGRSGRLALFDSTGETLPGIEAFLE